MMKAKLAGGTENRIMVEVKGASLPVINLIRRYVMGRVNVLAIDKVTMYENTSSMFDEYVSHRIGLLPIITPKSIKEGAEIPFSLDESGPKVVYSGDFRCQDKEVKMAKDRIPIITLFEGQHLRLEAMAVPDSGRKHAKFQSGVASYEEGKDGITFRAESFFQMGPKDLVLRACAQAESDLAALKSALKKAK